MYDTGDFIDDYAIDPILRNDQSFLFLVEADQSGYKSFRLVPVVIDHFCVHKAKGNLAKQIQSRMDELSSSIQKQPK